MNLNMNLILSLTHASHRIGVNIAVTCGRGIIIMIDYLAFMG